MKKWTNGERQLSDLKPYGRNPRAHSAEDTERLADAIKRFGFTAPILIDEKNRILAGHNRALAAAKIGLKTVPVRIVGDDWTDAERSAYTIWDNQSTILGTWDLEALRAELGELHAADFDLSLLGFSADQLHEFTAAPPSGADPEAVPEPPANPVSRTGDLWILGNHRLQCGDSTNAADVARLLGDAKPHLMITDSPYGVDYDPDWRNRADRANGKPYGASAIGLVTNDSRSDWTEAWKLFPGDVAYCWHAGRHASVTQVSLESAGFEIRCQIIWAKQQFAIGRGDYHWQHEPAYYAVRKGKKGHWNGDRKQSTLWAIDKPAKSETGHSTQKPIECMKRPIENNSHAGDSVYEPFSGSGTTIIAAEMTGRHAIAMEIAPQYCDIGVLRWQSLTGKEAVLDGDGRTFAKVAAARAKKEAPAGASKPKKRKATQAA